MGCDGVVEDVAKVGEKLDGYDAVPGTLKVCLLIDGMKYINPAEIAKNVRTPSKLRLAHKEVAALKVPAMAYAVGEHVEYHSQSQDAWIPAVVTSLRSALTYDLDVKPMVPADLIRRPQMKARSVCCSTAGCSRAPWNGHAGQSCCRTCSQSQGSRHGPDCENKQKASK